MRWKSPAASAAITTYIHPNDDVNKSQSTNDTYPAACKLSAYRRDRPLAESTKKLAKAFHDLADKHINDVTIGRTQLQDAVPMTYGQEFPAFATLLKSDLAHSIAWCPLLAQLNLGATAIGTAFARICDSASPPSSIWRRSPACRSTAAPIRWPP